MINLNFLAEEINKILGYDKYFVWLNTNVFPDADDGRTVVTMNVLRTPFAFTAEEFDAENLTITLTFDLPVAVYGEERVARDFTLETIEKKLLGWQSFTVEQPKDDEEESTEKYTVVARFEQQPAGIPYADSGRVTQQIVVSGTAQVQNVNCGALVGNEVEVFINHTKLLKVSRVSSLQVGTDNNLPLSTGSLIPEMHAVSRTCTKTLTFVYLGKKIEDEFLKIAEGEDVDVGKVYTYKATYPFGDLIQNIKILGVTTQDSAGVYLQYTLTVQVVE